MKRRDLHRCLPVRLSAVTAASVATLLLAACGSVSDSLPTASDPPTTEEQTATAAPPQLGDFNSADALPFYEGEADRSDEELMVRDEQIGVGDQPVPGEAPVVTLSNGGAPKSSGDNRLVDGIPVIHEACFITAEGRLEAEAVILNPDDRERDAVVEFEVIDSDGVRVSDGFDVVTDVAGNQRFLARDVFSDLTGFDSTNSDGSVEERDRSPDGWNCNVISVTIA